MFDIFKNKNIETPQFVIIVGVFTITPSKCTQDCKVFGAHDCKNWVNYSTPKMKGLIVDANVTIFLLSLFFCTSKSVTLL